MRKRIDINACKNCANETLIEEFYEDTIDFRGLLLEVEGLKRFHCKKCNHTWEGAEHVLPNKEIVRLAYNKKRELVRGQLGLLSGQEIHKIRELLDLTQKEASALFGGGANAFNKYESGEVLQSVAMDRLVRLAFWLGNPAKTLINYASKLRVSDNNNQYLEFGRGMPIFLVLSSSGNNVFISRGEPLPYLSTPDVLTGTYASNSFSFRAQPDTPLLSYAE
jgi:putative zinc finger/helix-turn-helix YgiT family protein